MNKRESKERGDKLPEVDIDMFLEKNQEVKKIFEENRERLASIRKDLASAPKSVRSEYGLAHPYESHRLTPVGESSESEYRPRASYAKW